MKVNKVFKVELSPAELIKSMSQKACSQTSVDSPNSRVRIPVEPPNSQLRQRSRTGASKLSTHQSKKHIPCVAFGACKNMPLCGWIKSDCCCGCAVSWIVMNSQYFSFSSVCSGAVLKDCGMSGTDVVRGSIHHKLTTPLSHIDSQVVNKWPRG